MKRYIIPAILAAFLTVTLLPSATYTYVVKELSQTFSALQTFSNGLTVSSGRATLAGNDVDVNETTAVVQPNASGTMNAVTHFDHVWAKSVAVQTGCELYDFTLYTDDGFDPGEELLIYVGQVFNLYDGAPPILRDTDGTGEIHAKFWNTGTNPCTFTLQVQGVGF